VTVRGATGLVTLEDIVEQIVGEIHDEHDAHRPRSTAARRLYWVAARTHMTSLNEALDWTLPKHDYELAGLCWPRSTASRAR